MHFKPHFCKLPLEVNNIASFCFLISMENSIQSSSQGFSYTLSSATFTNIELLSCSAPEFFNSSYSLLFISFSSSPSIVPISYNGLQLLSSEIFSVGFMIITSPVVFHITETSKCLSHGYFQVNHYILLMDKRILRGRMVEVVVDGKSGRSHKMMHSCF